MRRFSPIHLAIVVALIFAMAGAVAFAATHTPTDQQVFRVAVDRKGHMRLLGPEIKGKHNTEPKRNEFVANWPPAVA